MASLNVLFLIVLVASLQQITTADRCPGRWISWGHHCYRFVLEQMANWNNAEHRCRGLGLPGRPSHLASIHSKEEQNFLYEVFRLAVREVGFQEPRRIWDPRLFIGLVVRQSANDLSWSDGSCVDYQNWFRGNEPNNYPQSGAQITDGNGKNGHWCDEGQLNNRQFHYVCKMPQR
ncbi:Lectin 1 [Holothuria leucospilota]|uniref:Lectin 1 n=1 Tax=Holothuria leucospilota TaxID=206669 RepID=A0A9Q1BEL7_HOLLE|nr:Lectin 1 [Holothuria leucospilota]